MNAPATATVMTLSSSLSGTRVFSHAAMPAECPEVRTMTHSCFSSEAINCTCVVGGTTKQLRSANELANASLEAQGRLCSNAFYAESWVPDFEESGPYGANAMGLRIESVRSFDPEWETVYVGVWYFSLCMCWH